MGVGECNLFFGRVVVGAGKCGWVWVSAQFITTHYVNRVGRALKLTSL